MGKPTIWFPKGSDTNQAVQSQRQARSLKFWIKEEEEVYYLCSENKGADGYREADLRLIYADCWFSHREAQILLYCMIFWS